MPTAYHVVNYRRLNPAQPVETLEALCRKALSSSDTNGVQLWNRAQDRIFSAPGGAQIMLNRVADLSSAVFGEMCLLEKNGLQALLEYTAADVQLSNITTAQIFNLEERIAPAGSQFVRGLAYWLSISNHLFFVKTQSMTPEHIRLYLEWLVKSPGLVLQAEFDRAQIGGGDIGDIRTVRISGRAPAITLSGKKPRATVKQVADKMVEFAQALPVVEALLGKSKTQSLVESLSPGEYLTVDASVKVRGRRSEESKTAMRELASALADITDGKILVEVKTER
jgi:hypothetical protein